MESGAIADSQLTASSEYDIYHSPKRARLHTKEAFPYCLGGWASLTNDLNQWLQVDLGKITPVTHVATQGRNSFSPTQTVTKYKLQFSHDGASFLFYKRQGESSDAVNINFILRNTCQFLREMYNFFLMTSLAILTQRWSTKTTNNFFQYRDQPHTSHITASRL